MVGDDDTRPHHLILELRDYELLGRRRGDPWTLAPRMAADVAFDLGGHGRQKLVA
jgi:hypothetical protein